MENSIRNSALAERRFEDNTRCSACGAPMACGALAGAAQCWCMESPLRLPLPTEGTAAGCLCPACLARAAQPA